jgi:hypothetical protein
VLNVCPTGTAWTQVTFDTSAYAGQAVVLRFNDHDDGYAIDPTYFLLDDVAVASYVPTANGVQNGGFETGSLASWSRAAPSCREPARPPTPAAPPRGSGRRAR